MQRSVLVVAIASPVLPGSHSTRIRGLIAGLRSSGYRVCLLKCVGSSAESDAMRDFFDEVGGGMEVIEARGGAIRSATKAAMATGSLSPGLARKVQSLRNLVRRRAIPDTYVSWVPFAIAEGRRWVRKNCPVAIISSGAPFSSHIVGGSLSRLCRVPLVLDYGDPWVFEPGRPRSGVRLAVEYRLERSILSRCVLASFTTHETIELYRKKFPGIKCSYAFVPMGYSDTDFPSRKSGPARSGGDALTVLYGGRVGREYRSLQPLKDIVRAEIAADHARPIKFRFFGSELSLVKDELREGIESGVVSIGGNLAHEDFVSSMRDADGLLILGNNSSLQIPGKIAQSLAAARPILYLPNLSASEHDPGLHLLKSIQTSEIFEFRCMDDYWNFRASCESGLAPEMDSQGLAGLEWRTISKRFVESMESSLKVG